MITSPSNEVYNVDLPAVLARGILYSEQELVETLVERVSHVFWDTEGRHDIQTMLTDVASTSFQIEGLNEILRLQPVAEDWRIGEAMAEAYLIDNRNCIFPWPTWRDLKNANASPAGTDLVGFQFSNEEARLAFGEVKTSGERRWPPSVVHGRHGLIKQLEDLRDKKDTKNEIIRYLTFRAMHDAPWQDTFKTAVRRYFSNPKDVSLFGILVRDVEPKPEDIANRAKVLAKGCPEETLIELYAIYLPDNKMSEFVDLIQSRAETI